MIARIRTDVALGYYLGVAGPVVQALLLADVDRVAQEALSVADVDLVHIVVGITVQFTGLVRCSSRSDCSR